MWQNGECHIKQCDIVSNVREASKSNSNEPIILSGDEPDEKFFEAAQTHEHVYLSLKGEKEKKRNFDLESTLPSVSSYNHTGRLFGDQRPPSDKARRWRKNHCREAAPRAFYVTATVIMRRRNTWTKPRFTHAGHAYGFPRRASSSRRGSVNFL